MILTDETYYSQEANLAYMSVSQYKDFAGTYGKKACEEGALAKLYGRWDDGKSTALMLGSYVDRYFEGTLDSFKAENPEMFKRDGSLKSEYIKAEKAIQRAERDPLFIW